MQIQNAITEKVQKALSVQFLEIENESSSHHRDPEGETHFRMVVVSDDFAGKSRLDRQRMIMNLLEPERQLGLHALTLRTWTVEEWESEKSKAAGQGLMEKSPSCRGGGVLG